MSLFKTSREFPFAPEAVFDAIRNPERLARWWGPAGFTNTFHTFEFRDGGAWEFTMHGPDGTDYPNQSAFLEIVPGARVRIRHINAPRFEMTLTLEPHETGTLLSWTAVFENRAFAENAREFLETANEQNLDRLAKELGVARPGTKA